MLVKTMKKLFGSDDDKGATAFGVWAPRGSYRSGDCFARAGLGITVDSFFAGLGTAMVMAIGK